MAFDASTIWNDWSTGATGNGGGFAPNNPNFLADLTTDANTANTASPIVSSASYNFVPGDVGAWLFIQGGTNWTPGWYQIFSVGSNKATLTAGVGTGVLYGTVVTALNYHRPNGLNTAAGCATVGTPTAGVWSIDYSQQTTGVAYIDLVIDGTTNTDATSVAKPFGKQQLGNVWNVTSGTGFTVQRVQLTSIPSGVIGRFDKSLGTLSSSGGNATMGGATGSGSAFTAMAQALVAGNKVYRKGTLTLTSTVTITASAKGDTTNGRISVEGFTSYPGDGGMPTVTSSTNNLALFTLNDNDFMEFVNLALTHTAGTRGIGFTQVSSASSPNFWRNITIDGCLTGFAQGSSGMTWHFESVEVKNCTGAAITMSTSGVLYLYGCDVHDNAGNGITSGASPTINAQDCIFDTNAIGISETAAATAAFVTCHGCIFVDNTGDGIKIASTSSTVTLELENNIFYGNTGYGVESLSTQAATDANTRINRANAYGSNTTNPLTGITAGIGDVTLTADPFTNRASRDFSLNNTAGGGAACRAAAYPHTFISGTTTSYRDIGAAQHQDSGSSGGATVPTNAFGLAGVWVG